MILIEGVWWPDDVGRKWKHSLKHVRSLEHAIALVPQRRTAVQAGGNIGLWPHRLAQIFRRVVTFEPDPIARACLEKNVQPHVEIRPEAVGATLSRCGILHSSLGSHHVTRGDEVPIVPIDSLAIEDLDLLQLDVEGYELEALRGAASTIDRCGPIVQVELRGFVSRYGGADSDVVAFLAGLGYKEVSKQPGNDFVYERRR